MRTVVVFFAWLAVLAGQPKAGPGIVWPYIMDDTGSGTTAMSASATWAAIGFTATANRTLSEIQTHVFSPTGTPVAGDLRLALYSDNGGKPNTEIEGINSSGAPTNGWNTITGFTASVTEGTAYWVVIRNMNGTPASNYFSIVRRTSSASNLGTANSAGNGVGSYMSSTSADSGTNWSRTTGHFHVVLAWSGGAKEGIPIRGQLSSNGCQVYSSRECGLHFQLGPVGLRATGVVANLTKTGTPTGSGRFRLYEGTGNSRTLIATTGTILAPQTSQNYTTAWFSSTLYLAPWKWYTLVASETTQSDTSSNKLNLVSYTIESTGESLMMHMMASAPKSSLSTDGGATWADTNNDFSMIQLILDSQPYMNTTGGFGQ